jgi:hypothetical protein
MAWSDLTRSDWVVNRIPLALVVVLLIGDRTIRVLMWETRLGKVRFYTRRRNQ